MTSLCDNESHSHGESSHGHTHPIERNAPVPNLQQLGIADVVVETEGEFVDAQEESFGSAEVEQGSGVLEGEGEQM